MFLYYDTTLKILKIYLNDDYEPMLLEDSAVDSLYGVVLHSVNLNFDNFTELLVGAPAQGNTIGGYEQGAVHIYVGEATVSILQITKILYKIILLSKLLISICFKI